MRRTLFFLLAKKRLLVVALVCIALGVLARGQGAPKDLKDYIEAAIKAYQGKDYPALIENMKAALILRPTHQSYMYYLAKGYALSGNKTDALKWLAEGVNMGLVFRAAEDKDFDSLKDSDEFKALLAKIEKNKAHTGSSEPAFTIPEKGLITEGLAYDSVEKAFYVGSVYKRKIVKIDSSGATRDFATNQNELWSAMGMKVDAKRRLLWVATAAHPQMSNYKEEDKGKSAILKYDLTAGKLVKRYEISGKPKPHFFGDLTIDSNGDVFATDSNEPEIYVIRHGKDELELFMQSDEFVNCQGIAFSDDGKHLFMSDYSKGIFVIDTDTKKMINLGFLPQTTMLGIDGIYFYKGSLICVQNGVIPNRVVRVYLNAQFNKIDKFEIVEANHPAFIEPTLGVIVGDSFYYNADSQWGAIDDRGNLAPMDKLKEHIVLKVQL